MAAVGSAPAAPPPPAPAEPGPAPVCAQCGGEATERCAGCRGVHYCGRVCQRAGWPEHKRQCKAMMSALFEGKQLASERDFVLEFWAPRLPASCDRDVLLPLGEPFDAAGAFERYHNRGNTWRVPDMCTRGYRLRCGMGDRRGFLKPYTTS